MKTYCFNQAEVDRITEALHLATEGECECSECVELRALIDRLDHKPVQRVGWMNIYENDGLRKHGPVHTTQQEALDIGADPRNHRWGTPVQCVRVTWEE